MDENKILEIIQPQLAVMKRRMEISEEGINSKLSEQEKRIELLLKEQNDDFKGILQD